MIDYVIGFYREYLISANCDDIDKYISIFISSCKDDNDLISYINREMNSFNKFIDKLPPEYSEYTLFIKKCYTYIERNRKLNELLNE